MRLARCCSSSTAGSFDGKQLGDVGAQLEARGQRREAEREQGGQRTARAGAAARRRSSHASVAERTRAAGSRRRAGSAAPHSMPRLRAGVASYQRARERLPRRRRRRDRLRRGAAAARPRPWRSPSSIAAQPGREASWAAGGILAPQVEAHGPGPFVDLMRAGVARWRALRRASCAQRSGVDVGYRDDGTLHARLDDDEAASADRARSAGSAPPACASRP